MVVRYIWDVEVAGSNPAAATMVTYAVEKIEMVAYMIVSLVFGF